MSISKTLPFWPFFLPDFLPVQAFQVCVLWIPLCCFFSKFLISIFFFQSIDCPLQKKAQKRSMTQSIFWALKTIFCNWYQELCIQGKWWFTTNRNPSHFRFFQPLQPTGNDMQNCCIACEIITIYYFSPSWILCSVQICWKMQRSRVS